MKVIVSPAIAYVATAAWRSTIISKRLAATLSWMLPKSLADFDRSRAIQPLKATALYGRGLVKLRQGDESAGAADVAAALEAQPTVEANLKRNGLSRDALVSRQVP